MKKNLLSTVLKSTLFLLILTITAGMLQSCSSAYDTQRSEMKREMISNGGNGSIGSLVGAGRGTQGQDANVIKN